MPARICPGRRLAPIALGLFSACSDPGEPHIDTGALALTVSTTGGAADPDGYVIEIGEIQTAVGANGTVVIDGLAAGRHSYAVQGLAPNCTLPEDLVREVNIPAADTASAQVAVSCPSAFGGLSLVVEVGGIELDPDGFSVRVGDDVYRPVAPGVPIPLADLPAGEMAVTFEGLASTCRPTAQNPMVTVFPDRIVLARVDVQCGWIVATARRGDRGPDFYRIAMNGAAQWVAGTAALEWDAALSPDQSELVFGEIGGTDLKFLRPGETDPRIIETPEYEFQPSWSRATGLIAYMQGDSSRIFVMHPDGTGVRALSPGRPYAQSDPAFSPDGSRIAFNGWHSLTVGEEPDNGLWVINVDGSGLARLTDEWEIADPDWSPDGSEIAFASGREDGLYQIYVIRADGTGLRRITDGSPGYRWPAWSPSGSHLAITRLAQSGFELYTIRHDGTGLRAVPGSGGGDRSLDWVR
jgi:hypothetical protein